MYRIIYVDRAENQDYKISLRGMKIGSPNNSKIDLSKYDVIIIRNVNGWEEGLGGPGKSNIDISSTRSEKDIIDYAGALGVLVFLEDSYLKEENGKPVPDQESRSLLISGRVGEIREDIKTSYEMGKLIIPLTVEKYTKEYSTVGEMEKNFKKILKGVSKRVIEEYPQLYEFDSFIRNGAKLEVFERMPKKSDPGPSAVS